MQLNLFQWEMIETGEGYQFLGRLEFAEARSICASCFASSRRFWWTIWSGWSRGDE